MNYLLVTHNRFTDKIDNSYFENEEQLKTKLKEVKKQKYIKILHIFKIEDVDFKKGE